MTMLKLAIGIALAAAAACQAASQSPKATHYFIPGQYVPDRGPDGNSVFLEAPRGLILVDTGRHPEHRDKLLAYARERGRPIVAIINTHWHFDHTTSNGEILAVHPKAEVIASRAIDGRLYQEFSAKSRKGAEEYIASGKATPAQVAEIRRGIAVMDAPSSLRAKRPVERTETRSIAGRKLVLHLAPFAATEGDVWVYDPKAKLAVVGDLVVGPVPFMDTACVDGWQAALKEIAATPWETLIPGHGAPMTRADFKIWHSAFEAFVECGRGSEPLKQCGENWVRDAAAFIPASDRDRMKEAAEYYSQLRFRLPKERGRFCPGRQGT